MKAKTILSKVWVWLKSFLLTVWREKFIILSLIVGITAIGGVIWSVYSSRGFIFFNLLSDNVSTEDSPDRLLLVFVAIGAASLTLAAFLAQYQANQRVRKEFRSRQSNEHFYKMLDIHARHVENLTMTSYRLEGDDLEYVIMLMDEKVDSKRSFTQAMNEIIRNPEKTLAVETRKGAQSGRTKNVNKTDVDQKPEKQKRVGREVFQLMIKDFHLSVYLINEYCKIKGLCLDTDKRLMLAYKFFFWGASSQHLYGSGVPREVVSQLSDYLCRVRKNFRNNKGSRFTFTYQTIESPKEQTFRFIPLSGHVIRLAHYYRFLYQTVKYVHRSFEKKLISRNELDANLDTLRALMTNDEQLLLYYNYMVGFGNNWDRLGENEYQFLSEYRMLHNIPLYDHIPEGMESPEEHWKDFIAEKKRTDSEYTLFEWSS